MRFGTHVAEILSTIRRRWRIFLGIHIAANLLSLAVLTPLYTLLTGWLVPGIGGYGADRRGYPAVFALSPLGLLIVLIVTALYLTLMVFEQSALFLAAFRLTGGRRTNLVALSRHLLQRAWAIFLFALRTIGLASLLIVPVLLASAWIVGRYLSEYDINYYLAEKPPELWLAAGAIVACLLLTLWPMMGVLARWFIGLPPLLVAEDKPGAAFRRSLSVSPSVRLRVALIFMAWIGLNAILLGAVGLMFDFAAGLAIRIAGDSLQVLVYFMGVLLLLWLLTTLFATFFTSTILALAMLLLNKKIFPEDGGKHLDQRPVPQSAQTTVRVSWLALAGILLAALVSSGFVILAIANQADTGRSFPRLSRTAAPQPMRRKIPWLRSRRLSGRALTGWRSMCRKPARARSWSYMTGTL